MQHHIKFSPLLFGLLLAILVYFLKPAAIALPAWQTFSVLVLMVSWWITTAVPISVTSIIPLIAFPLLQIQTFKVSLIPYFHPLIFLFLGGFLLATALQKWNCHKRLALHIILKLGINERRLVLGFMISAAFLSLWVSNTASTIMLLPVGLSVIDYVKHHDEKDAAVFATVLMLAIAYSATIGGMGTIIGTVPNAFTAAFLTSEFNIHISFLQWMAYGVPLVIISLPLVYIVLTRVAYRLPNAKVTGSMSVVHDELNRLGKMSVPEKCVTILFSLAVLAWCFQPLIKIVLPFVSDPIIAMTAGMFLFLIPSKAGKSPMLLTIFDLKQIPWFVLILLGGGLSLAAAIKSSGLALIVADLLLFTQGLPFILIVLAIIILVVSLSEVASNTAITAIFIPIIAALAISLKIDPLYLVLPATFAASCAFMLPIATPPNAIVFSSRAVTMPQMIKAGLYLNLVFIVCLTLLATLVF